MNKALAGRTDGDYLKGHEAVKVDGMGIIGFCSGGRRALPARSWHPGEHSEAAD
jgi:dienelactone hydrolase